MLGDRNPVDLSDPVATPVVAKPERGAGFDGSTVYAEIWAALEAEAERQQRYEKAAG